MWGAIAGAGLGLLQNYTATNQYTRNIEIETEAKLASMAASKASYQANVDALILQGSINEMSAANAIVEAERAGAATVREASVEVKEGASTIASQSEGITGGVSAARQLSSFYTKASKQIGSIKEKTTTQIIDIADRADAASNAIKAQEQQAYNSLLLSLAGVSQYSSLQAPSASTQLTNIMSGVSTGVTLEKNLK